MILPPQYLAGPQKPKPAVFLDVDGTLLELASRPESVIVPTSLLELLEQLNHRLDHALALVSGRDLVTLGQLFPIPLTFVGSHGVEWLVDGVRGSLSAASLLVPPLVRRLHCLAEGTLGLLVERKQVSVALHYRNSDLAPVAARAIMVRALGHGRSHFKLLEGHKVIEAVPLEASKGAAIARLMGRTPFAGRYPIFIGDDYTDEDAFTAVNRLSGISIRVGVTRPTEARYGLPSVTAVHRWLAELSHQWEMSSHAEQPA